MAESITGSDEYLSQRRFNILKKLNVLHVIPNASK